MPTISKKQKPYNYNQTDKELIASLAKKRLPSFKQIKYLNKFLSKKESLFLLLGSFLLVSGLVLLFITFYNEKLEINPVEGGKYTEGAVGSPQFINPLYASSNGVDADLTKLIYSSLFTRDKNGSLAKDLVEDYQLSPDQKTYTIKIKQGVKWHNNTDLTVDDVIYTIQTIQDTEYHSPLKASLSGVAINRIDDQTLSLTLPEAYAPFVELLTFGIMPKDVWEEVSATSMTLADLNLKPIGSGPYEFSSLIKDKAGSIHSYTLEVNPNYYGEKPYINKIVFKFFGSPEELVDALNNGQVDGASYLSNENIKGITAQNSYNFNQLGLPENTAVFFNLRAKEEPISNLKIREALAYALNKQEIINNVLGENAEILNSPINPKSFASTDNISKYDFDKNKALSLLKEAGWQLKEVKDGDTVSQIQTDKQGKELTIKLSVIDSLETIKTAEAISASWQEIGVKTDLTVIAKNDIDNILKSKNFTCLVYNWTIGIDPDPYTMWHSSQAGERGQNISGYQNSKVDKLLEEARLSNNFEVRKNDYFEFQKLLTADVPAIFLYTPHYIYLQNKQIKGFNTLVITSPEDRLSGVSSWYLKESKSLNLKK